MAVPGNTSIASGTQGANIVRVLYPQTELDKLFAMSTSPLFSRLSKSDMFYGSSYTVDFWHDHAAVGWTIDDAEDIRQGPQFLRAAVTRAQGYSSGQLDWEAMAATANIKGAAKALAKAAVESCFAGMLKLLSTGCYMNGASIGVVSGVSSNTVTMDNRTDVYRLSVGQTVQFNSSADGSGTARTAGTDLDHEIVSIDHGAGTFDVTNLATDAAADDYVIAASLDKSLSSIRPITGLEGWVPLTAPSSGESFFGMDRSVNIARMSGHRLNDLTMPVKNIVQLLAAKVQAGNGKAKDLYINPMQGYKLYEEIGAKLELLPGGTAVDGFEGFKFPTPAGVLNTYMDPFCPENRLYIGNTDASCVKFPHRKALPHFIEEDGNRFRQVAASTGQDAGRFFMRFWGNMAMERPCDWGVANLNPVNL